MSEQLHTLMIRLEEEVAPVALARLTAAGYDDAEDILMACLSSFTDALPEAIEAFAKARGRARTRLYQEHGEEALESPLVFTMHAYQVGDLDGRTLFE